MNSDKLEALRAKYADAKGGDIFDPEFAAVAAQVFANAERRKWPFSDPATLLGLPFRSDVSSLPDLGGLDVALVGVPMDLGVTNRSGARMGPRAVRAVEIGAQGLFTLLCLVAMDPRRQRKAARAEGQR